MTMSVILRHWYVKRGWPSTTNWCSTCSRQDSCTICTRSCITFSPLSSHMKNGGQQLLSNRSNSFTSKGDKRASKSAWRHSKRPATINRCKRHPSEHQNMNQWTHHPDEHTREWQKLKTSYQEEIGRAKQWLTQSRLRTMSGK